jgi:hypothetical protein
MAHSSAARLRNLRKGGAGGVLIFPGVARLLALGFK